MSLLNVVVGEGVAWAAFDTASVRVDTGERCTFSKAVPLVHANTLICLRGECSFLAHAFLSFFVRPSVRDFDSAAAQFEEALSEAFVGYGEHAKALGLGEPPEGIELSLLGWSAKRAAPVHLRADRAVGANAFAVRETRAVVAPAVEVSRLATVEQMVELAKRQVAMMKGQDPGAVIGGDLILAEITADAMTFRRLCEL